MPEFHQLTVQNIKRITPNAVDITLNIPENLKEKFVFKAGQYLTIEKEINGEPVRRSYSISSAPISGKITTGIKKMSKGVFSTYANEILKEGDFLQVGTPEGRFVFEPTQQPLQICAFAAGSGITPILSIAQTVLEGNAQNIMVLVYGNATPEDTMYHKDLQELEKKYNNRFFIHRLYSQANVEGALFGRIEKSTVNLIVKNKYKDHAFDAFYLCGPEGMINTVEETLQGSGFSENKIFTELFSSSNVNAKEVAPVSGNTKLKVVLDEGDYEIELKEGEFLLDAVLKADIDAPYSCQGGVCSSCIARVTEGEAEMVKNQILTDAEVAEGLILSCQAKAKSAVVKIDYDDV